MSSVSVTPRLTELYSHTPLTPDPCFTMDATVSLLNKTCGGVSCTYTLLCSFMRQVLIAWWEPRKSLRIPLYGHIMYTGWIWTEQIHKLHRVEVIYVNQYRRISVCAINPEFLNRQFKALRENSSAQMTISLNWFKCGTGDSKIEITLCYSCMFRMTRTDH